MTYAIIENGSVAKYPIELRQEFPHVSFPEGAMPDSCLPTNVVRVIETDPPVTTAFQVLIKSDPVFQNGEWVRAWAVDDVSAEDAAELYEAEHQMIRNRRNGLLAGCDWTQLRDSTMTEEKSAEWTAYRQELRDLPQNTPEPFLVVWPTPPSA